MNNKVCRFCAAPLEHTFVDLGMAPLSNAYLGAHQLTCMEPFYPLHAFVCYKCFLVQLEAYESPEKIFSDYAYFSSYSSSWLDHCRRYVDLMVERFKLDREQQVIEIASNDGYLLQYFKKYDIPVLGIEPAENVAAVALEAGIPTVCQFFGVATALDLASKGQMADLLLGNNVLAHVPDINDFVSGMKLVLKADGIITMEFPHLLQLIRHNQFDTIYHEHFSYLSLTTALRIFELHGLSIFDVQELATHGGSLRVFACHRENIKYAATERFASLLVREHEAGLGVVDTYNEFALRVHGVKRELLRFLIEVKGEGKSIVGYGAAAKGNTLLNYCGIRQDFLDYVVDRNPHKQGKYLPGTHMSIFSPERITETRPDYLLILPWNLREEIMEQMAHIREWGGKFVVPIPEVQVFE